MDGLKSQAAHGRNDRDQASPDQRVREERASEQPADLGGRIGLEDQARPEASNRDGGGGRLESVEDALDRDLMAGGEGRRGPLRGGGLAHPAIPWGGGGGAHGGGGDRPRDGRGGPPPPNAP